MTETPGTKPAFLPWLGVLLAIAVGLGLLVDSAWSSSATYDEAAYLRVGSHWWRTGEDSSISRMGSPVLFLKLQQTPTLFVLDRIGRANWIDAPIEHQAELLPRIRVGGLWIWVVGLLAIALWARDLYGPLAMVVAAWLYAMSPNLLGHSSLATMEPPIVAAAAWVFYLFWRFLARGSNVGFWGSAIVCGLAFSCKFTAVVFPFLLGVGWLLDVSWSWWQLRRVIRGMLVYVAVMLIANVCLTGFALLPMSTTRGEGHPSLERKLSPSLARLVARVIETPIPQDWTGFFKQVEHQRSGGSSYLLGVRRQTGWKSYYLIAMAVKLPLACWFLIVLRGLESARGSIIRFRSVISERRNSSIGFGGQAFLSAGIVDISDAGRQECPTSARSCRHLEKINKESFKAGRSMRSDVGRSGMLLGVMLTFLLITSLGSSRNYGIRYLLPIAPVAVVWISGLFELAGWRRILAWLAIGGQIWAVGMIHPGELTYFNELAGGRIGGRRILADSNLDWGQGLKSLARIQAEMPEYRDLTLYYFGDTEPSHYGVAGTCHVVDAIGGRPGLPARLVADTRYLAVSASLQWGPWGPEGYFSRLEGVEPVAFTDDTTIAIYRSSDLKPGQ